MSRLISFIPNEYYHVYNRGVNKSEIFNESIDYARFQKLLYTANSKETDKLSNLIKSLNPIWEQNRKNTLVDIGCYCLMPNHFHILIKSKNKEDTAKFLQRVQMGYAKYFNSKNGRTGSLFQGKSKAEHVIGDNYLKYLFSYIHLNPIKLIQKNWKEKGISNLNRAKEYLKKYKFSSYIDFTNINREENKILNLSEFPEYFPSKQDFEKEVFDWLNYYEK